MSNIFYAMKVRECGYCFYYKKRKYVSHQGRCIKMDREQIQGYLNILSPAKNCPYYSTKPLFDLLK